jgi:hypothetical protein
MTPSYQLGSHHDSNFAQDYGKEPHGWKPEPATPVD